VSKNHRTTAAKVAAELSTHLEDPVPIKAIRPDIDNSNIRDRAAIAKPLIAENNTIRRKRRCDDHKTWTLLIGNM
jgi:hypothetical protein